MAANTSMTVTVSPETKAKLTQLAADTQCSEASLAEAAIATYVERELEVIDGIKRGIEDAATGRVIPHEQAVAEMREAIAEAKGRKSARA